jgi:hypothetical protein
LNGHAADAPGRSDAQAEDQGGGIFYLAAEIEQLAFACAGLEENAVRDLLTAVPEFESEERGVAFFRAVLERKAEIESATRQQ